MKVARSSTDKAVPSRRRAGRPATPARKDGSGVREIAGIAIGAVAIALAIALLTGERAPIPGFVADVLRLGFGIGAYAIPVFAVVWAATFFAGGRQAQQARIGLGLLLSFVAIITMSALASPAATQLQQVVLSSHGGWVGGLCGWALRSLLGVPIAYVVSAAAMLAGLVVAGVSFSRLIESATTGLAARRQAREADAVAAAGRPSRKAGVTLPMPDGRTPVEGLSDADARNGRAPSRRRSADPEATRSTLPATGMVAPLAMEGFELPPLALLTRSPHTAAAHRATEKELAALASQIESTLGTFDIPSEVTGWTPGPTVTLFRVKIAQGVKVNRVTVLADDLALALAAPTIRILAPIPGESLIGIEVPNELRSTVTLGDVLAAGNTSDPSPLLLGIGKDVAGESIIVDLAAMPHLLIAGSTGTGKSVCINALLTSILMRATPSEVRLILIDPKRIELSSYNLLPQLYVPVVTETKQAASALAWAVAEMESRLKRLQKVGARNIGQLNAMVVAGKAPEGTEPMPYIVIVIDELADLMMVAAREVEDSIVRIAQLARAAGIHLIVATQRPSTDIITGLIKTNITNRIAFAVGSGVDSRVILDTSGAERLVGKGDMLFSRPEWPKPKRIQGAFVSMEETEAVVEHLRAQAEPDYHEEILTLPLTGSGSAAGGSDDDPLLWDAADIVVTSGLGSTSMLQRRLSVGYARAGRIMDMLEAKGVVGAPNGSKPRDVLCDVEDLESIRAFERRDADAD